MMKINIKIGFLTAVGLAALTLGSAAQAVITPEFCTVNEPNDVQQTTVKGDPIGKAIYYANLGTPTNRNRLCSKGIIIQTDVKARFNMMFAIPETSPDRPYLIRGEVGPDKKPAVLNFDLVQLPPGKDPKELCVVDLRKTRYIRFENIIITGGPASGICVGGKENDPAVGIDFRNVKVDSVAGHGIIFRATAKDNILRSGVEITHTSGVAVQYLGDSPQDYNLIEPTNREVDVYEPSGLAKFKALAAGVTEENFRMFSIGDGSSFISAAKRVRIRINEIRQIGARSSTIYRVVGDVVQASPDASKEELCSASNVNFEDPMERMQLYSVKAGEANSGEFFTFVGPKSGTNGVSSRGASQGNFRFEVDTGPGGLKGATQVILVPELKTNTIAGSSRIFTLVHEYTDCPGGVRGGGGGGGLRGGASRTVLFSMEQCTKERDRDNDGRIDKNFELDPQFDSDRDGISDKLEDTNQDCSYTEGLDISNWMEPDTDSDGILDGDEISNNNILIEKEKIDKPLLFCKGLLDPCNPDGDDKSNAADVDSDGDGLPDYVEARRRVLNPWKAQVGKLYIGGERKESCPLGNQSLKGIIHGVYMLKPDGTYVSHNIKEFGDRYLALEGGESLILGSCRSEALDQNGHIGNDFDNTVNLDEGETDPYKTDSDGDNYCDGNGGGCVALKPDLCPSTYDAGTPQKCENELCSGKRDLYQIRANEENRKYLEFDPIDPNEPLRLMKSNGEYDLFTIANPNDLFQICENFDGDGIPDCVERMDPECSRPLSEGALSPDFKDSDHDGKDDKIDANPFDAGIENIPVSDADKERLMDVFRVAQVPLIRCFVDRDEDGLTDCEEDLDKGNDFDRREGLTLEAFLSLRNGAGVESHPLKADTDNDGAFDKTEKGVGTNPQKTDTDDDLLSDRVELKGEEHGSYVDVIGAQCGDLQIIESMADLSTRADDVKTLPEKRIGTNPLDPDTDKDGLKDGVEVVGRRSTARADNNIINPNDLYTGTYPGDIDFVSNPLSSDSDGDTIPDAQEYGSDGVIQHTESSPCDSDTDGDGDPDVTDPNDTSRNAGCLVEGQSGGPDADCDGLSDRLEAILTSNPDKTDSDGDGLDDGVEDANKNGRHDPEETFVMEPDSDGDKLNDGIEKNIVGTNPLSSDTDSDCIPDGLEVRDPFAKGTGVNTDPKNSDTDGDGLCDGNFADGDKCLRGEDINCNGEVDRDPKNPDNFAEFDPRQSSTAGDGVADKEHCTKSGGGRCDLSLSNRIEGANRAIRGCSLAASAPANLNSLFGIFGFPGLLSLILMRLRMGYSTKH